MAELDMSDAEVYTGKNGLKYARKKIADASQLIPEDVKNARGSIMLSRKDFNIYFMKSVPKTEEEKEEGRKKRRAIKEAQWKEVARQNEKIPARRKAIQEKMNSLRDEIRKQAVQGKDVSALQERMAVLKDERKNLKVKPIPKAYRKA